MTKKDKKEIQKDIIIRTVRVLGDRAKAEAISQGFEEDDLVIVETMINSYSLPQYKFIKIEGSPTQWLYDRMKE